MMLNKHTDERGFVLVACLLILMVVTLIGIQALDTTDIELVVTTNDRTYKEALNAADGGSYIAAKTVSEALNESESPVLPGTMSYIANDGTVDANPPADNAFYRELLGFDPYEPAADIAFTVSPTATATADVERLRAVNLAGGGAEFSASYSGVGASGPKGIYYGIRTQSNAPANSTSRVYVQYMKALGVAGGL